MTAGVIHKEGRKMEQEVISQENPYSIIRGTINGKNKYCRIPIRSKLAETMIEDEETNLSAEKILAMPHDKAIKTIDAIMQDWLYWLKRAGELWVLTQAEKEEEATDENI